MLGDGGLLEHLRAIHQIFPHEVFGEGEGAERHLFTQLETGHVARGLSYQRPHAGDIDTAAIAGQAALQPRYFELEILPQHFEQREIKARLVFVLAQRKAGTHAATFQPHRQQNQGRAVGFLFLAAFAPVQKAQRDKQRIGAALAQIQAAFAIKLNQRGVVFIRRQRAEEFILRQSLPRDVILQAGVLLLLVQLRIATRNFQRGHGLQP